MPAGYQRCILNNGSRASSAIRQAGGHARSAAWGVQGGAVGSQTTRRPDPWAATPATLGRLAGQGPPSRPARYCLQRRQLKGGLNVSDVQIRNACTGFPIEVGGRLPGHLVHGVEFSQGDLSCPRQYGPGDAPSRALVSCGVGGNLPRKGPHGSTHRLPEALHALLHLAHRRQLWLLRVKRKSPRGPVDRPGGGACRWPEATRSAISRPDNGPAPGQSGRQRGTGRTGREADPPAVLTSSRPAP